MTQRHFPLPSRWRPGAALLCPDGAVADWLLDAGSLTRRVKHACGEGFAVQVVGQGWARPLPDEALRLGLRGGAVALIREVFLVCGQVPWVFGRTVIPPRSLRGQRRLARLGSQPLGEVLFARPDLRRDPVEVTALGQGEVLYARACRPMAERPARIWGRRRVFWVGGKPLLVSDFFLPAALARSPHARVTVRHG